MTKLPVGAACRLANADPEFRLAARSWDATLCLTNGGTEHVLSVRNGEIAERPPPSTGELCDVRISASPQAWREMLAPTPRPFYQDLFGALTHHGLTLEGDLLGRFFPFYPAARRLIELLRDVARDVR